MNQNDTAGIINLFDESLTLFQQEKFPQDQCLELLKYILGATSTINITRVFLAVLNVTPNVLQLSAIIKALDIDKSELLRYLDPSLLVEMELVDSGFGKRIIKTNTNLLYRQKRFNLLREESEGFAKFILEVHTSPLRSSSVDNAKITAANIEKLIGYFDLDPVRSLDIFLDVMADNIMYNCQFYLQVLQHSPWWPKSLSNRNPQVVMQQLVNNEPVDFKPLGNGGNYAAAQILGFKLQNLNKEGNVSPTVAHLTAVLIKEGFVSLGDLYAFLSPADADMDEWESQWKKEMDDKAFEAKASALALAAPLADDNPNGLPVESSSSRAATPAAQTTTSPADKKPDTLKVFEKQKAGLLFALVAIGAMRPALYLMSRFPFISRAYPDIADMIHRIVEFAIEPLYSQTVSVMPKSMGVKPTPEDVAEDSLWRGPTLPTLDPRKLTGNLGGACEFYYSNWTSELCTINSVKELKHLSYGLLKFTNALVGQSHKLMSKLCRIGNFFCQQDELMVEEFWQEYFRQFILPGISLVGPNFAVINDVYSLMQHFTLEARYSMYGEWSSVVSKTSPHLKLAVSRAEKQTKDILKKLSKQNVKQMMRRLAKVSCSNPVTSFTVFISQVESYDNLGDLVVEAARYFPDLGWDVLPYVVLTQLTSGRGTQQVNGMTDRKWIQSLSSFTSKLCHQYSNMDPKPILLYLVKQLHTEDSTHVTVLRSLLSEMAGISQLSNLTTEQVEGFGGGPKLRSVMATAIDNKQRDGSEAPAKALLGSLQELGIVCELFVGLVRIQTSFIYKVEESMAYQKVMAHRYDELTHVLNQYIELIIDYMDSDVFEQSFVSIPQLCGTYGVPVTWAFALWRMHLGDELRKSDAEPVLEPLISAVKSILPASVWDFLDPNFYVNFWQLSLYDIYYPESSYESVDKKIQDQISGLETAVTTTNDNVRESEFELRPMRREIDRLKSLQSNLRIESKRHSLHFSRCVKRLELQKSTWFAANDDSNVRREQIENFLSHCILPRCIHSPMDAVFCARFIWTLHSLGLPNLNTLSLFDKLFSDGFVQAALRTCTLFEAENFGLFISTVLEGLEKWRKDKMVYLREALGYSGESTLPGFLYNVAEGTLLDFDMYRSVLEKWHSKLSSTIIDCLGSEDYMHRQNAIILLKNTINIFPATENIGWELYDKIEQLKNHEVLEDLKLSATALFGHLYRRSKDWIPVYEFRNVSDERKQLAIALMEKRKAKNASMLAARRSTTPIEAKPKEKRGEVANKERPEPAKQQEKTDKENEEISSRSKTRDSATKREDEAVNKDKDKRTRIFSESRQESVRNPSSRESRRNSPQAEKGKSNGLGPKSLPPTPRLGRQRDRESEREREEEKAKERERERDRIRERERQQRERDRENKRKDERERERERERNRERELRDKERERRAENDRKRDWRSRGGRDSVNSLPLGSRDGSRANSPRLPNIPEKPILSRNGIERDRARDRDRGGDRRGRDSYRDRDQERDRRPRKEPPLPPPSDPHPDENKRSAEEQGGRSNKRRRN